MPNKLAYNAEAVCLNVFLHRRANIADGISDLRLLYRLVQRRFRYFEQLLALRGNFITYSNGNRRIAVISVQHHTAIDRNNVSGLQHPLRRRDPVHDLVIHRRAQHARIIVIALECRFGAEFLDLFFGGPLEIQRRHTRSNHRLQLVQDLADDVPAALHLFNLGLRFTNDRHASISLGRAASVAVDFLYDRLSDIVQWLVTIDRQHPPKFLIVLRHWLGLALIRIETLANDLCPVIVAGDQPGAILVADFVNARRIGIDVIDRPIDGTSPPSSDPEQQLIIIHLYTDHNRQPRRPLSVFKELKLQERIEPRGLLLGARE